MKLAHLRDRRSVGLLAGAAFVAAIAFAQPAAADTDDDTLDVTATVTSTCSITAGTLAFGNVDVTSGNNVDTSTTINVTCTSGTDWEASADEGLGEDATLAIRQMTDGDDNTLDYILSTQSDYSDIWGDGVDTTELVTGTGTGSAQTPTIYGRVLSGQSTAPTGAYSDTVTVTVTYN